jgi:hypothetical protein
MATSTQYKLQKDVAGYNGFGLQVSNQKYSASLAITTDTTLTVPSTGSLGTPLDQVNKFLALIQVEANLSVWMAVNATAAVPAGSTFAATTSELIIGGEYFAREVKAGDVLHFIAPTAGTDISVVFYALPAN